LTPKTIMLADLPSLLRDTLANALADHPELPVVIRDQEGELIAASAAAKAQVVVTASSEPTDLHVVDPALGWAANLSIVAIASDGPACIHRIRSETQVLEDVTPQGIVAALVGAAGGTPNTP
jgi:hypothetical protein